jgi:energy-coupling factor transporter ATP-binding protein EcfA2
MRIDTLTFGDGTTVKLGALTVLIGPNNVGKSRALREIPALVQGHNGVVATSCTLAPVPTFDDLLREFGIQPEDGKIHYKTESQNDFNTDVLSAQQIFEVYGYVGFIRQTPLGEDSVRLLSVGERFGVTLPSQPMDLARPEPSSALQRLLLRQREIEPKLKSILKELFGVECLIDESSTVNIVLRIAKSLPSTEGLSAVERAQRMTTVQTAVEQGDGIRSFIGVTLPMLLNTRKVLLIDEPDAFLHPEQTRALGAWIGLHCANGENQVLLATHNEDLLYGLLTSGSPVTVLRLDRPTDEITTVRPLAPDLLDQMARSPLLSGQTVLHALFQRGVVVVEAPNDRAVYEAVAATLGSTGIVFVHAQNKQTLKDIAGLMHRAGVPVAAVADLDIFYDEQEFINLLAVFAPDTARFAAERRRIFVAPPTGEDCAESRVVLEDVRAWLNSPALDAEICKYGPNWLRNRLKQRAGGRSYWDKLKSEGLDALGPSAATDGERLLAELSARGLFVVPVGELERWFGEEKSKEAVIAMLEQIHDHAIPPRLRDFVKDVLQYLKGSGVFAATT